MRSSALLAACLVVPASSFSAPVAPVPAFFGRKAFGRAVAARMAEGNQPDLSRLPLRSIIIGLITADCANRLATTDLANLIGSSPDYFGTLFDLGFLGYGVQQLSKQFGILPGPAATADLAGFACSATLSVGREPSTWMPADWAASGARLSLPVDLKFTDEPVDLGFPGEESMNGRAAKRLDCEGGSFVGPQGVVAVKAAGGAWSIAPAGRDGANVVRFFIDFPEGASRNDVSLPAGRVFFSCACWDGETAPPEGAEAEGVVGAPGGVSVLATGGLTIKRNDARNLYGALGDVNLILGRFALAPSKGQ